MTGVGALNGVAFALALATSTGAAWLSRPGSPTERHGGQEQASAKPTAPGDLVDRAGVSIPRRDYRRIVSGSTVADAILVEICEPDRVVAVAAFGAPGSAQSFRYAGKPMIQHIDDLEHILALHPDLVLVNAPGDARPAARLREAGLIVFDLGETRGLSTLIPEILTIADILGHPERGEKLARAIVEQMVAIAADVPSSKRPRAMYLSIYGDSLFGGAPGTSYHDVLIASGLLDAASAYRDWPQYTPEEVLAIAPQVIVTNAGMRAHLCGRSGLATLGACQTNRVVEVDNSLLGDPGLAMVDAAHVIRAAVHGSPDTMDLAQRLPNAVGGSERK